MTTLQRSDGARAHGGERVALRNISVTFGATTAVRDADFEVAPGEIHALLGENGAGKTTLMRVLAGYQRPDTGSISIGDRPARITDPGEALDHGIGMVHQHSVLVPELTVAENIMLGRQPRWWSRYAADRIDATVTNLCERYEIPLRPSQRLADLSADRVQQVEILRLLHRDVSTLVLDEPTAILGRAFVDRLFSTLDILRAQGHAIVIITHKLREVLAIADRATVMRSGRVVSTVPKSDLDEDHLSAALMIRRRATQAGRQATGAAGRTLLSVRDLTVHGDRATSAVDRLRLDVREGEIVGISGVEGNGQRELVEAISGLRPMSGGSVTFDETIYESLNPAQVDQANVAVISEDRMRWDIIGDLSLAENLVMSQLASRNRYLAPGGVLHRRRLQQEAALLLEQYTVSPPLPRMAARHLSGGNQQKLVLARELSRDPAIVIGAHPTRGLDVSATEFVLDQLRALRDRGCAILLVSSDLDELCRVADRIVVMYRGQVTHECEAQHIDLDLVSRAMTGTVMGAPA